MCNITMEIFMIMLILVLGCIEKTDATNHIKDTKDTISVILGYLGIIDIESLAFVNKTMSTSTKNFMKSEEGIKCMYNHYENLLARKSLDDAKVNLSSLCRYGIFFLGTQSNPIPHDALSTSPFVVLAGEKITIPQLPVEEDKVDVEITKLFSTDTRFQYHGTNIDGFIVNDVAKNALPLVYNRLNSKAFLYPEVYLHLQIPTMLIFTDLDDNVVHVKHISTWTAQRYEVYKWNGTIIITFNQQYQHEKFEMKFLGSEILNEVTISRSQYQTFKLLPGKGNRFYKVYEVDKYQRCSYAGSRMYAFYHIL